MPNNSPFNINARLRLDGPDGLDSVVRNVQKAFARPISINASLNNTGLKSAVRDLKDVGDAMDRIKSSSELAGEVFGATARRFGTFVIVSKVFNTVADSIGHSINEAVKFQHEMVRLAQIGGTSSAAIADIGKEIGRLSTDLGASSKELSQVSVTLRQAGFAANEVKIAMDALAKTSLAPTFESMKSTTEGVIAMRQQFGVAAEDISRRLGAINTVAGEFAVESEDIVTAIKKAGGAFRAASGDFTSGEQAFNQFISLFTSVRNTTRESSEEIATGLRTIFARVQSNSVANSLKEMGVNLRWTAEEAKIFGKDVTGQFVGAYEAVRRLSAATRNIPTTDPRFAQIVEQLGGFRQISRVIPLLQQFGTAQKAYTTAQAGANSLTSDAAKAQDSLIVKTAKLTENMNDLMRTFLNNKGIQTMISGFLDLASAATEVVKKFEPIIPLITTVAAAKLGLGLRDFGRGALSTFKNVSGAAALINHREPRIRRATGGVIPGVGRGDKVPMDVPAGSYILKRDSARKIGYDRLHAWMSNKGGRRYASGGSVVPILTEPGEFYFDRDMVKKLGISNLNRANQTGQLPDHLAGLSDEDPRNRMAKKLWMLGGMRATTRRYASGGFVSGRTIDFDKIKQIKNLAAEGGTMKVDGLSRVRRRFEIDPVTKQPTTRAKYYAKSRSIRYASNHVGMALPAHILGLIGRSGVRPDDEQIRKMLGFVKGGIVDPLDPDELKRRIAAMQLSSEFEQFGPELAQYFNVESGNFDIGTGGKAAGFYKILDKIIQSQTASESGLGSTLRQLGSQASAKSLTSEYMKITGKSKARKNSRRSEPKLPSGSYDINNPDAAKQYESEIERYADQFIRDQERIDLPTSGLNKTLTEMILSRSNDANRKKIKHGELSGGDAFSKSVGDKAFDVISDPTGKSVLDTLAENERIARRVAPPILEHIPTDVNEEGREKVAYTAGKESRARLGSLSARIGRKSSDTDITQLTAAIKDSIKTQEKNTSSIQTQTSVFKQSDTWTINPNKSSKWAPGILGGFNDDVSSHGNAINDFQAQKMMAYALGSTETTHIKRTPSQMAKENGAYYPTVFPEYRTYTYTRPGDWTKESFAKRRQDALDAKDNREADRDQRSANRVFSTSSNGRYLAQGFYPSGVPVHPDELYNSPGIVNAHTAYQVSDIARLKTRSPGIDITRSRRLTNNKIDQTLANIVKVPISQFRLPFDPIVNAHGSIPQLISKRSELTSETSRRRQEDIDRSLTPFYLQNMDEAIRTGSHRYRVEKLRQAKFDKIDAIINQPPKPLGIPLGASTDAFTTYGFDDKQYRSGAIPLSEIQPPSKPNIYRFATPPVKPIIPGRSPNVFLDDNVIRPYEIGPRRDNYSQGSTSQLFDNSELENAYSQGRRTRNPQLITGLLNGSPLENARYQDRNAGRIRQALEDQYYRSLRDRRPDISDDDARSYAAKAVSRREKRGGISGVNDAVVNFISADLRRKGVTGDVYNNRLEGQYRRATDMSDERLALEKYHRDRLRQSRPDANPERIAQVARRLADRNIKNDTSYSIENGQVYYVDRVTDNSRSFAERRRRPIISRDGRIGRTLDAGRRLGSKLGAGSKFVWEKGGGVGGLGGVLSSAALYSNYIDSGENETTIEGVQNRSSQRKLRSAATFGGVGFQLGSMTGNPVVAALGAVAGSIYGTVSEIDKIAKDIAQIKLDEAFRKLGNTLDGFNTGRLSSTNVAQTLNNRINEFNRSTVGVGGSQYNWADSLFGIEFGSSSQADIRKYNPGGSTKPIDYTKVNDDNVLLGTTSSQRIRAEFENRRAKEREVLQPVLPQIRDTFQKSLVSSGRIGSELFTANDKTNIDQQRQARQGIILSNGGRQLIETIARVQQQSFEQVLNEFDQEVVQAGRARSSEQAARAQANQIDLDTRRFERLGSAIENATSSLQNLEKVGDLMEGLAGGRIGSSSITGISGQISQIGGIDATAANNTRSFAINSLGGGRGSSIVGEFSTLISEMDDVKRSLSGRLVDAAKGSGYDEESIIGTLSNAFKDFSSPTQKKLQTKLDTMDAKTVLQELTANPDKLADQISDSVFGEIDKIWEGIVKGLEEESARYANGLGRGEALRQVSQATSQRRPGLLLDRENLVNARNRTISGRDIDTSLTSLLTPFNERQQALGGFNVDRIRGRLGEVQAESERQQNIIQDVGTGRDARKKAQDELLKLSRQSADLTKALENLSDTSTRLAAINQKIAEAERVRDSQSSLAERLITGDPSSQFEFQRGLVGAEAAGYQGNLAGFSGQDAKLVLDTLRAFGDIQFKTGPFAGFTGSGAADRLITNSTRGVRGPWGGNLDATKTISEIGNLQEMAVGIQDEAIKANDALADYQKGLADRFFANLNEGYNKFFAETERRLAEAASRESKTNVDISSVELDRRKATANKLYPLDRRFRIEELDNDNGLARLRGLMASPDLAVLQQSLKEENSLRYGRDVINRFGVSDLNLGFGNTGDLSKREGRDEFISRYRNQLDPVGSQIIRNTGLPRSTVDEALNLYLSKVSEVAGTTGSLNGFDTQKAMASFLNQAITKSQTDNAKLRSDSISRLSYDVYGGYNQSIENKILSAATNREKNAKALDGLDRVESISQAFKELQEQTKVNQEAVAASDANTAAVNTLTEAIKQGNGQPVLHKSLGGPVFSPRGTDTIPAMLTRGEYVVPADIARANLPLLKSLRPEYRATGGLAGYKQEVERTMAEKRRKQIAYQEKLIGNENERLVKRARITDSKIKQYPPDIRRVGPSDEFLAKLRETHSKPTGLSRPLTKAEQHARRHVPGSYRRDLQRLSSEGYTGAHQTDTPRGRQLMAEYRRSQTPKRHRKRYRQTSPWEVRGFETDEENYLNAILWGAMPYGFANGGVVPNRGTDTVPTVLTPGEIVIPKKIAQAHRTEIQRMTSYRADGGNTFRTPPAQSRGQSPIVFDMSPVAELMKAQNELTNAIPSLVKGFAMFVEPATNLTAALNNFNPAFPERMEVNVNGNQTVTVNTANIEGAMGQVINDAIKTKIVPMITEQINNYFSNKLAN